MTSGKLTIAIMDAVLSGQTALIIFEQLTEEQKRILKDKHYRIMWNNEQTEIFWGKETRKIFDPHVGWIEETRIGSKLVDARLV